MRKTDEVAEQVDVDRQLAEPRYDGHTFILLPGNSNNHIIYEPHPGVTYQMLETSLKQGKVSSFPPTRGRRVPACRHKYRLRGLVGWRPFLESSHKATAVCAGAQIARFRLCHLHGAK